jgi:hypothetical protein
MSGLPMKAAKELEMLDTLAPPRWKRTSCLIWRYRRRLRQWNMLRYGQNCEKWWYPAQELFKQQRYSNGGRDPRCPRQPFPRWPQAGGLSPPEQPGTAPACEPASSDGNAREPSVLHDAINDEPDRPVVCQGDKFRLMNEFGSL